MSNLINQKILSSCLKNTSLKYGATLKSNGSLIHGSYMTPVNQRFLFTANYLGVDTFENQRTKVSGQFGHLKDNLIERMKSTIEGKNKMIFSEDLKNSIFLVSNEPEDVALLKQVISKYTEQTNDINFSTYQFGPVVMRLLYLFGDSELAYNMLMDDKYKEFFNQERSFLITMDLCWEQGKYQQILDLYDRFRNLEGRPNKYPRDVITLVAAACYKLNTPEAFKYCLNLFVEIRESKTRLTRRAISFFSALALKQNDPEVALESLTLVDAPPNSAVLLSIRIMALASLKRIDDILYIIRNIINRGRPIERAIIIAEAVEKVDSAVEASENSELRNDWENIKRALEENKLIQENSLEPIICNPIERTVRNDQPFRQGAGGYGQGSRGYGQGAGGYGQGSNNYDQQRDNRFRGPRGNQNSGGGYRRNDNYGDQRRRNYDSRFREEDGSNYQQ